MTDKSPLLSFHNDPAIKHKYLNRLQAHYDLDEIVKGIYWEDGRGCAVGCTVHSAHHSDYEDELGIPMSIARLEDSIFESLPNAEAKEFPLAFLKAVPVGVDLSLVAHKFMHWLLVDPDDGVVNFANTKESREEIQNVAALYLMHGEIRCGAYDADDAAAAYRYAADRYAGGDYIHADLYARDTADCYDGQDDEHCDTDACTKQAAKLIELLKEAK